VCFKTAACVDSVTIVKGLAPAAEARLFYWSFNVGAYVAPLTLSSLFYAALVRVIWRQKVVQSKSSQRCVLFFCVSFFCKFGFFWFFLCFFFVNFGKYQFVFSLFIFF
jgi:hypothetical protein